MSKYHLIFFIEIKIKNRIICQGFLFYSGLEMYLKLSKLKIMEFLLENKRCISRSVIFKIFRFMCQLEGLDFEFTNEIRNKIKYTLNYLEKKWKLILRRQTAKKKFLLKLSDQTVEFKVEIKNQANLEMDIDSETIEGVFKNLHI